jgi:molybdopterin/thiamine biosynthesis adenylyltransferase
MLEFNADVEVDERHKKFSSKDRLNLSQIVISCVDTMAARKTIFETCLKCKSVQLFIDTRMAGLQGQVYSVDMNNKKEIANYKKTLFGDDEAVRERCTARSILFTVLGIASIVCSQVIKALNGEKVKNYIVLDYSVPQLF